ncbi:hypothetical protein Vretimale_14360 [Volvox reticuliferus]|uniref:Uncharacterized protein n=1 Tax=Volvox reticuliferus TaxID=1737510 RepID=A0A8J4GM47_9CHLO|nr:hypothetical protein Vretifemale_13204 [Volvox reticuliferus]GIM10790.1 hypothetical protein Vretimale_14360 [Volvox reticuliferus]
MTSREWLPRLERILSEIPDLTIEQRNRARTLFLQRPPGDHKLVMSYNDDFVAAFLKCILKDDWDLLYMLQRFWATLFPAPDDGSSQSEGPASSNNDSKLIEELNKANLRRRTVQSTART